MNKIFFCLLFLLSNFKCLVANHADVIFLKEHGLSHATTIHASDLPMIDDTTALRHIFDSESGRLSAVLLEVDGETALRWFYVYDNQGKIQAAVVDDGEGIDQNDFQHVTERQLLDVREVFSEEENSISPKTTKASFFSQLQKKISKCCSKVEKILCSLKNKIELKLGKKQIREDLDKVCHHLASETFLRMAGYYDTTPDVMCLGNGEISSKVRITFINGILNHHDDVSLSTKVVSELHGGNNVHCIFKPTQGWSWDLLLSLYVKLGCPNHQTKDLVSTWRKLIQEMGGVEGGGRIIHYAHSIGAADTYVARHYLSHEERQMIDVCTFGSPLLIPNDCFHTAVNYVSVRDFVPLIGRLRGVFEGESDVIYVGSHLGIPFIDHLFDNDSYRSVIEELGKEFTGRYSQG